MQVIGKEQIPFMTFFPGQNARVDGQGQDLYSKSLRFREVINRWDRALNIPPGQSLNHRLQLSGVAFGFAAREALIDDLGKTEAVTSGLSIGENPCYVITEMLSLEKLAIGLDIRAQESEKHVIGSQLRAMFATRGIDADLIAQTLESVKGRIGDSVQAVLANVNAPKETVISVLIESGKLRDAQAAINETFGKMKGFLFMHLAGINNAFHSRFMAEDEERFIRRAAPLITLEDFSNPNNIQFFSPMQGEWVDNRWQARNGYLHQITSALDLPAALKKITERHALEAVVIFDPTNKIMANILRKNLDPRIELLTVYNYDSLRGTSQRLQVLDQILPRPRTGR